VKTLGERSRLVTDGSLDESLLIAARDLKRPLQLVNFHAAGRAAYMEYVASLFQSQRMTNLAHLGMLPLMQEWFESEPGIEQTAAVMTVPDLWTVAGCQMVPSKMLFLGVRSRDALRPEQLLADHERFWNEQIPPLARLAGRDDHLGRLCAYLVQRIAVTANDLGVLLEDMGRQKEAFDVYAKARAIDPENLSALLNQNVMARNGWAPEQTETLKRDLEQSLKTFENQKATLWSLALRYGYVRMPEVAARMGLTWALSGQAGLGVAELKRAADMADDIGKDAVRQLLAGVYLAQQKDEESEAIYRDLLKQNPRHGGALIGLARIEIGRRNLARAESLIGEAEAAGVPRERIVVDRAGLRVAEGKDEAARAMLESLLREKSDNVDAWRLLATILLNRNEDRALEDCLARMQKVSGAAGYAASISAAWAIRRQDWAAARSYTRDALAALPNRVDLMEGLVRIELALGGTQEVAADVRRLLQADPRNAIGNYAMGSLQMRSGETDLAEDSLRTSLKAQRTSAALNDLAWLLCEKGAHKEAEALAREALGTDDKLAPAWDTLGVILMRTGRLPEAQEAVERSLALYQGDAVVFLHMAEMQALKKDFKGARETLDVLYQRANQLSPQDQEKLNSLNRQVDEGRTRGGKG
jgi:Tfp pilus assembly protein PilF